MDVPEDLIPPPERDSVALVRASPTVVRPLVVKEVGAPLAVFERLLDDLPGSARIVERLGKGRYRIEARSEDRVEIDDGRGAYATVSRLVHLPGIRAFRATGGLHAFPLPPLDGTGLVTLRFEASGADAVRTGGQIYFRLDSRLLHFVARPLVKLLHAVIDARVNALVLAAIAACEHEAARAVPSARPVA